MYKNDFYTFIHTDLELCTEVKTLPVTCVRRICPPNLKFLLFANYKYMKDTGWTDR